MLWIPHSSPIQNVQPSNGVRVSVYQSRISAQPVVFITLLYPQCILYSQTSLIFNIAHG